MKPGDLVRVKIPTLGSNNKFKSSVHLNAEIGMLVAYETWEKVATVLLASGVRRVRAEHVEKAGKKDLLVMERPF